MQLEQESGRTYQAVVEDFEKKRKEETEAEEKKSVLESECEGLKTLLADARKGLAELTSEIEKAIALRRGLAEIGLHKLAQLIRFIRDFESLGFDAGQMKKLAVWHRELEKLHIDPSGLDKFIAERGSLEAQNNSLKLDNERIEANINTQATRRVTLFAGNSVLEAVDLILRTGTLTMLCKFCGLPLPIWLPTQETLGDLISTGKVASYRCPSCHLWQWFTPWEIALQIAWPILPTNT